MGSLKIGDLLCNPDGSISNVIAIHPLGKKQLYKFTFKDNSSCEVTDDHLWLAWKNRGSSKKNGKRFAGENGAKIWVTTELYKKVNEGRKFNIPINQPVTFTDSARYKRRPVNPYHLGVLLGDGCLNNTVRVSLADKEIADKIKNLCGNEINPIRQNKNLYTWSVKANSKTVDYLKSQGLYGKVANSKFIPKAYLLGSIEERWELLRGLMDTDGTVSKIGECTFSSASKQLVDDIAFLAHSLGAYVTYRLKYPFFKDKNGNRKEGQTSYIIRLKFREPEMAFYLPRKKNLCLIKPQSMSRQIVSIEKTTVEECQCITVSHPNGLYITNDFIVTHNSVALLMAALQYVDQPNYSALLLRRTYAELALPGALMDLAAEWLQPFRKTKEVHWAEKNKTYTFKSGATLTFGFLEHPNDKYRYQGAQFQFIGYDELTQFDEQDYIYLFSRSRRTKAMAENVPIRFRVASNPGGIGHCVPFGDVLTPKGWVPIQEITTKSEVFTVASDGKLNIAKVDQTHKSFYEGDMVNIKTRNLDITCTPNHSLPKLNELSGKFELTPFDNLPGQATLTRSVTWQSHKELKNFSPPEINLICRKSRHNQPDKISGDNYLKLLGWMLSEGFTSIRPLKHDWLFGIAQSKQINRMEIKTLLDSCGFIYRQTPTTFTVASKKWASYFKQFGKCRDKFIPQEIKALSKRQLQLLFDAMMAGDGCRNYYYTSSKRLADDFCEIAIKLGYIVKMNQRQRRNRQGLSYEISCTKTNSGGTYLSTGHHLYNVTTSCKRKSDITKTEFKGFIYCLGIDKTHTFIIRQNGSVWISGNSWVKKRFLSPEAKTKGRIFIPAILSDNKHLDYDSYVENLMEMDPIEREQLLNGDWEVSSGGKVFKREWFEILKSFLEFNPKTDHIQRVRYWDLAASDAEVSRAYGYKPAFTVGLKMAKLTRRGAQDLYIIENIKRFQKLPNDVEFEIIQTALQDGKQVDIWMEEEPGSSGKKVTEDYKKVLSGFNFHAQKESGSKVLRASKVASTAGNGQIKLIEGFWNNDFLDEVDYFPDSTYKDQVDCLSGAFDKLRFHDSYSVIPKAIGQENSSYWLSQSYI